MTQRRLIKFPLQHPRVKSVGLRAFRIVFPNMDLSKDGGEFDRSPYEFRLDTGTDFMTIPKDLAKRLGISLRGLPKVRPHSIEGKTKRLSWLTKLWFSFPELPDLKFQANCLINPTSMRRCLISLNDIVPNFIVRSQRADEDYPTGFVAFQLRAKNQNKGVPSGRPAI